MDFLCQRKRASQTGIFPSFLGEGGRPSWREFFCLFVGSAGSVDGARETGVGTWSGGEASRVLDVGGAGEPSPKRQTSSQEGEKGFEPGPRDGVAPA